MQIFVTPLPFCLKGIRCESAKSGLQSIIAENQSPSNVTVLTFFNCFICGFTSFFHIKFLLQILQKKIEAPNGLPNEKNVEVTSKYNCAVPHHVHPNKPVFSLYIYVLTSSDNHQFGQNH